MSGTSSNSGGASEISSSKKEAGNVDGVKESKETKNKDAESKETKYDKVADFQSQEASGGDLREIKQENNDAACEAGDGRDSDDGFFDAPEGQDADNFSASNDMEISGEDAEGIERQKELNEEEKARIKEETGWSDEIVDAISSMEEYEVYKKAGLVEAEIDGRPCLINPNIDMDQTDAFGRTNKERMEAGLAPLDKDGNPIELHHIGQHADSPLAELTQEQHRGKENYGILHDTKKESEIDRPAFDGERQEHWKARAEGENK